ncbi:hypothetical protein [Bradyrhizobium sp. STM 3557]|uniref:hypothetical protein n=1 Tax=Bradyrhizobium sp. STM 3557 TaxID=578920 RepID=UPI00388D25E0
MFHRKTFEPTAAGVQPAGYLVVLNRRIRALGELHCDVARQPPIWSWRILVGQTVVANGAASTLPKAKAAVLIAWKGCAASLRAVEQE